jgi:hypothetical protein
MTLPIDGSKKGTTQFERMGHTASQFGSEPNLDAKGKASQTPRDLKP